MQQASAHIIGRGIIGLSMAYELATSGWRICVVGPKGRPGSATAAAVGVSSLKGHITAQSSLFAIKMHGHEGLRAWLSGVERDSGRRIAQNFGGVYEPFFDLTGYEWIRERVFHRKFGGCLNVRLRDPDQLPFSAGARGAFHYVRDCWFDPAACIAALEEALLRLGVSFCEQPVEKIVANPVSGVSLVTPEGPLHAAEAVLAAGIFSNEILANSGIYHLHQEPVEGETVRGLASGLPDVLIRRGKWNHVVHGGSYVSGSTSRRQSSVAVCAPSEAEFARLRAAAGQMLGSSVDMSGGEALWGIRGRFKDRAPAVGPVALPGGSRRIWVSLGFYKNGLQLAPLFARKLAALLMTDRSAFSAPSSSSSSFSSFLTARFER